MIYPKKKPEHFSSTAEGNENPHEAHRKPRQRQHKKPHALRARGEVLDTAGKSGLKKEEILDFSSSVNPLGPSKRALGGGERGFQRNPRLPRLKQQRSATGNCPSLRVLNQKQRLSLATAQPSSCTCSLKLSCAKATQPLFQRQPSANTKAQLEKLASPPKFLKLDKNFNLQPRNFLSRK